MKPKCLDLFCGAGGASMGLHRAGFDVTGVDINPQKNYPFEFIHADAMTFDLSGYDFIHASPPCQKYSIASQFNRMNGVEYPDLVAATRDRLFKSGIHFMIENVPGAPVRPDLILCGSMFGLKLVRHRLFEFSNPFIPQPPKCKPNHHPEPITVCGHGTPSWVTDKFPGRVFTQAEKRDAMGIDWMTRGELSQSIPPAYTEFIGRQIIEWL